MLVLTVRACMRKENFRETLLYMNKGLTRTEEKRIKKNAKVKVGGGERKNHKNTGPSSTIP